MLLPECGSILNFFARYEDAPCITKNLAGFSMILHNYPYRNAKGLIASWMFLFGCFWSRYLGPWTEMPWNKQRPCWKKTNLPIPKSSNPNVFGANWWFQERHWESNCFFLTGLYPSKLPTMQYQHKFVVFCLLFFVGTLHLYLEVWNTPNQQGILLKHHNNLFPSFWPRIGVYTKSNKKTYYVTISVLNSTIP